MVRKNVSVTLPVNLIKQLKADALANNRSFSGEIRNALEKHIFRKEKNYGSINEKEKEK